MLKKEIQNLEIIERAIKVTLLDKKDDKNQL